MKKILGLLFSLVLCISLVGCGSSSKASDVIGVSLSTLDNPFFVTIQDSAKAKAKDLNATVEITDAKNDSAKQASDIESLIAKNIKVLVVNPVDSKAVAASVKQAKDKGIKIISVDRSVEGVDVDLHIASDNVAGGKLAGEYVVKQLNGKGKVIELEGIPGASAAIERGKGFDESIKGKLDLVAKQTAEFDRAKGLSVMENLAQANPGYNAVFAQNDEMILGALKAINSKDVITVGFDGTEDALKAIKAGDLDATVIQQPDKMGELAIENATKMIKNEKDEKNIPVSLILVTKDNVANFLK